MDDISTVLARVNREINRREYLDARALIRCHQEAHPQICETKYNTARVPDSHDHRHYQSGLQCVCDFIYGSVCAFLFCHNTHTVSQKSEYTPQIFVNILIYLFMGQQ